MADILGINLSQITISEALGKIKSYLEDSKQHYVVTPNPEIILASSDDEEFFYILNKADLSLADGFGLKVAGWIFGERVTRATGSDLTVELLKIAAGNGTRTAILNWRKGLSSAEEISQALKDKFPSLIFSVFDIDRDPTLPDNTVQQINSFAPALLFSTVGFPYQEKIIFHNLGNLPSVRVALGVGGSFDFLTGRAKRAPRLFRRLGLEWLWRLIKQPQRYRRIFKATFVFLHRVLKAKFINPFRYRRGVVCLLYKNTPTGPQILAVERKDQEGHWQMPQGGTDGEDIETAGRRELREETNAQTIAIRGVFRDVYRYDFSILAKKSYPQNNEPKGHMARRYIFNYKGQSQGLFIAEFLGQDEEIRINFWDHRAWRWIPAENLLKELHPYRHEGAEKFLKKFWQLKKEYLTFHNH